MDLAKAIADVKNTPGFADNVGMMLIHNGVVRGWSRQNKAGVTAVEITPDNAKIQALCEEFQKRPGIFRATAFCRSGILKPGDDVMYIIVAGDIRENVKSALSDLLDRIKNEAVTKREVFA